MGVSKNSGTPKWMVKIMENPIKMDDLGFLVQHPYQLVSRISAINRSSTWIQLSLCAAFTIKSSSPLSKRKLYKLFECVTSLTNQKRHGLFNYAQ